MAIKAGRVGVRPDQVDDTGKIIFPEGSGPGTDSYTKAEADAKFATKSDLSSGLATKANAANVYSKTAADEKFSTQTALAELAQSTQTALADKADAEDVYDKEAADAKFATAEALEVLAGDVEDKADADDVYDKTAADAKFATQEALADKADADDVYDKTAADSKFATITALNAKADQSNLTANNNNFIFAYDSASGKYGYKAGGADTFHPFNEGGGSNPRYVSGEILYETGPTEDVVINTAFGVVPKYIFVTWVYAGSIQTSLWYDYYFSQQGYRQATKSTVRWNYMGEEYNGCIKSVDTTKVVLFPNASADIRRLWYFIAY